MKYWLMFCSRISFSDLRLYLFQYLVMPVDDLTSRFTPKQRYSSTTEVTYLGMNSILT
ncbi:MAG TPA: hypothetical protein PL188_04535 [Candidatus Cloacimonadota bacterium]|nr:hypothetical protein [Candidatus Cloacimonadota bacterium]